MPSVSLCNICLISLTDKYEGRKGKQDSINLDRDIFFYRKVSIFAAFLVQICQDSQAEIDHLFTSLVLPNFLYDLPIYGASEPDLNIIQNFLDGCHKRRFISYPISIKDLLNKQDCKIFKKVISVENHRLGPYIPSKRNVYTISAKDNVRALKCTLSVSCLPL